MPAVSKTEIGIQKIIQTRFGLLLSKLRNINCFNFTLPGSSFGSNVFWSVFLTYQSYIRPTNGDMRLTLASAHATA